jgi:ZIP family zinc transporter
MVNLEQIGWIVLITAIAGVGGTGLGGVVACAFRRDSSKTVSLLLSFAAGVMLSVVCLDLIPEAIGAQEAAAPGQLALVCGGILAGYGIVFLLNHLIDQHTNNEVAHIDAHHPRTADNLDELIHSDHLSEHKSGSKSSLFIAGIVMACAIALHNLPEGMVIGASFASNSGAAVFSGSGMLMAVIIGLHNIPEGMAVSVPLISGGMSRVRAVVITALSGAPTILGALAGYYIGTLGSLGLSLSLSFASGAMLYVVFGELMPEAILMWRSKMPAFLMLVGILTGILIIFA